MDYLTYRMLHIGGLVVMLLAIGGMIIGRDARAERPPKIASILHGVGLLVILVAGFGMAARREYDMAATPWIWAKVGVWLLLGAFPVLARRGVVPGPVAWPLVVALVLASEWLAHEKPWM